MQFNKCVFFDRDGIVNQAPAPGSYVLSWSEFHLVPEFPICLRIAREHGYEAAIVTNQRAVALGLIDVKELEAMHLRLRLLLQREYNLSLLDIIYCPHQRDSCMCRKPQPGMLLALAQRHHLDLSQCWMVGDAETDIESGRRAGCRTIRVGIGPSQANALVPDLAALPASLEQNLRMASSAQD